MEDSYRVPKEAENSEVELAKATMEQEGVMDTRKERQTSCAKIVLEISFY